MSQKHKKVMNYYAVVQIEAQVAVKAIDEDDAENQINEILGGICFDSHIYYESIDYESHTIQELNFHEVELD
ncbi:MAG: hypothetical protein KME09_00305 [Pleurocapsa minor HA4230-MV1]|jgi:hypothetical protein|nr:hypothetical protein [Pleurocapsa minor HA4230-MV1]